MAFAEHQSIPRMAVSRLPAHRNGCVDHPVVGAKEPALSSSKRMNRAGERIKAIPQRARTSGALSDETVIDPRNGDRSCLP